MVKQITFHTRSGSAVRIPVRDIPAGTTFLGVLKTQEELPGLDGEPNRVVFLKTPEGVVGLEAGFLRYWPTKTEPWVEYFQPVDLEVKVL